MKKQVAFTLSELIVVTVLLLAALFLGAMKFLNHAKNFSSRVACAAQLSGLGKAFSVYQHDFMGSSPVLWGKDNTGTFGMGLYNKYGQNENTRWCDPNFKDWEHQPTVGGCLFLLVKYSDVTPEVFLCYQDEFAMELTLDQARTACEEKGFKTLETWMEVNDFQSGYHFSYSYNDPWKAVLNSASAPDLVVMADQSPAYDTETRVRNSDAGDYPLRDKRGGWSERWGNCRPGNSRNHYYRGQNVLFADSQVKWFRSPTVGIDKDNIYTYWPAGEGTPTEQKQEGRWDQGHAASMADSYLGN